MKKSLVVIFGIALAIWAIQIAGPMSALATSEEAVIVNTPVESETTDTDTEEAFEAEEESGKEDMGDEDPLPEEDENERDAEDPPSEDE